MVGFIVNLARPQRSASARRGHALRYTYARPQVQGEVKEARASGLCPEKKAQLFKNLRQSQTLLGAQPTPPLGTCDSPFFAFNLNIAPAPPPIQSTFTRNRLSAMRTITSLLFYCLLFTACQNAPEGTADADPEKDRISALLTPNRDSLTYPVYTSFDEVASLFDDVKDNETLVINFWATWCQPCVEELPYFEQLARETDARVVMISLDFKKDVATKLKKFVEQRELKLPIMALADGDYNSWIDRVDPSWGGAIPVTLIRRGNERRFHDTKFDDYEELLTAVAAVSPS
jgi:thiol-disulfide isomerase/thioredoxin